MPWKEVSVMSQRKEFVILVQARQSSFGEVCVRFGISRVTGYKWLSRYDESGDEGLVDMSRRPHRSPFRTAQKEEEAILGVRDAHPVWGARKIKRRLENMGHEGLPSPSTITAILHRNGRMSHKESDKHKAWQRFEYEAPNELWQMDFKGHFPLSVGRCYPLTVLDDHSRYAIGLVACPDEQGQTVKDRLSDIFRLYGLPQRMVMDNGNPWGTQGSSAYSGFEVWLMRLGIRVYHGRPRHPQTQGKDERFHRTLKAEVLGQSSFTDLEHAQKAFDRWRPVYNHERPHQALDMEVPASRYHISPRAFPQVLSPIEYAPDDLVRIVQGKGEISFHSKAFRVGMAFKGFPVALRPTTHDGVYDVFFMTNHISILRT